MTRVSVHSELHYTVTTPSTFLFQVLAAQNPHQAVEDERIAFTPGLHVERFREPVQGNELLRTVVEPGPLSIVYDATVSITPYIPEVAPWREVPFAEVPPAALAYLNPSRYCPSDLLGRFAFKTFGHMAPGVTRVTAVCNWIYDHMDYVPGSTDSSTTALDVLSQQAGVCRDYAHLGITICRALGIPARYVSGYAVDLEPPDFHGFFETYLDGDWYLFDATRMAPIDGLARIGVGRDAADVAFAATVGSSTLDMINIVVIDLDRTEPYDGSTTAAISTA